MSVATVTVTVSQTTFQSPNFKVWGTLAISASPDAYAAGGLTLNFNDPLIKAQRVPLRVDIQGQAGYIFRYIKGTNNTDGKLKIFEQSGVDDSPLDEYDDTVAIAAALSGDTINFYAEWLGML